jgi:hypothetical protein
VVIDAHEQVVAEQRFVNDRAGYRSMKTFARSFPERTWAVRTSSTSPRSCPPGSVRSAVA